MCSNNKLSLSNAISTVLPLTQLRWLKQTNAEKKANVVSGSFPSSVVGETLRTPTGRQGDVPALFRPRVPASQEEPSLPSRVEPLTQTPHTPLLTSIPWPVLLFGLR